MIDSNTDLPHEDTQGGQPMPDEGQNAAPDAAAQDSLQDSGARPAHDASTAALDQAAFRAAPQGPREFQHSIQGSPDFARLTVRLPKGGMIRAEASAMISMDTNISMKTKFKGGLKRFLTSESLFLNEFKADQAGGQIEFANGLPGDIFHYHLDGSGKALFLQSGAYLAAGANVEANTKFQGLVKGFFSGAGLFLIKCEGKGDVYFNSYGSIIEIDVKDRLVVDNNHIVAFTDGLTYDVRKVAGYKSLFLSGEGLVTMFSGQGKVWVQTRKFPAFARWVFPFRPVKSKS